MIKIIIIIIVIIIFSFIWGLITSDDNGNKKAKEQQPPPNYRTYQSDEIEFPTHDCDHCKYHFFEVKAENDFKAECFCTKYDGYVNGNCTCDSWIEDPDFFKAWKE